MVDSQPSNSGCADGETRRILAASSVLTVEACRCGVVHLHFGPVTMRFTATALDELHRTIADARVKLCAQEQGIELPFLASHQGAARGQA